MPDTLSANTDAYTFSVVEHYNDQVTTTKYEVYPTGPAPADAQGSTPAAGIYLLSLSMVSKSGTSGFTPRPMIQIMTFPAVAAASFGGTGTDGANRESETVTPQQSATLPGQPQPPDLIPPFTSTSPQPKPSPTSVVTGSQVISKDVVNACGKQVDSWKAEEVGNFSGPTTNFSFDDLVDFATQYGGFIVKEHRRWKGTDAEGSFTLDMTATINVVPQSQ